MSQAEYNISEEIIDRIISAAYGEADAETKNFVNRLIENNAEAKEIFYSYKKTAASVNNIKMPEAPESLNNVLDNLTAVDKKRNYINSIFDSFTAKPLTAVGMAAAILIIVILSLVSQSRQSHNGYTEAEILRANKQVVESLALVGRVFKETQSAITNDILGNQVSRPIKESIKTIDYLFLSGGNNEK